MYLEAESEDGYRRDESVFGHYISIEDDMAVLARYRSGATMSYHLTAYAPWEGFRMAFNGTQGRLEHEVTETSCVAGARGDMHQPGRQDEEGPPPGPCWSGSRRTAASPPVSRPGWTIR